MNAIQKINGAAQPSPITTMMAIEKCAETDETAIADSESECSGSISDVSSSSDYDYDTDDSSSDDDSSVGISSVGDLEAKYKLNEQKKKGILNRGGSFGGTLDRGGSFQQPAKENIEGPSPAPMPGGVMQLEMDFGNVQLSEDDNRSMRDLLKRMSSARSYFQEVEEEDVPIPKELEISHQNRRGSKDDMALMEMTPDKQSPQSLLDEMLLDLSDLDLTDSFWQAYFLEVTPARQEAYSVELVKAMRGQDLDTLRSLYQEGTTMEACNQQGEALLHLACRRRNHQLVKFLVDEAKVSPRVRDDWGKTPLHELCWHSKSGKQHRDQFDSIKLLVRDSPELLFAEDKRGFTPLQYVPKDAWKDWSRFLGRYTKLMRCKVQMIGFVRSRNKLQETLQKAESAMSLYSGGKL